MDRPALYVILQVLLVVELDIIDDGGVISRDLWMAEVMLVVPSLVVLLCLVFFFKSCCCSTSTLLFEYLRSVGTRTNTKDD